MRPEPNSYPSYYDNYIPLVKQENVIKALKENWNEIKELVSVIPIQKEEYAYADGKWTIKQVINHLSDTERIFAYRALRFARKDSQQPLAFEENDYAANSELEQRNLRDLMEEFETVRNCSLSLFKSFSDSVLLYSGKTSGGDATVLALGYLISGHAKHHLNVIKERYL